MSELEPLPSGPFTLALPPRRRRAEGGKQLLKRVLGLRGAELEAEIYAAIASGNVPSFLRTLAPIEVTARGRRGALHQATLHVTPDYLAIGSDDDFLRIPMTPQTAQRLADLTGSLLPTPRIVDEIWTEAPGRLEPHAFEGGPNEENKWEYELHDEQIEAQRRARGYPLGMLLAGHKKDIVATRRLRVARGRVAIYGWHTKSGHPVQPLTTVHSKIYADYSHGVRLVHETVLVDGAPRRFGAVLADPELCRLVSGEGPLTLASVQYPHRRN